jgi:hypothetical protein
MLFVGNSAAQIYHLSISLSVPLSGGGGGENGTLLKLTLVSKSSLQSIVSPTSLLSLTTLNLFRDLLVSTIFLVTIIACHR